LLIFFAVPRRRERIYLIRDSPQETFLIARVFMHHLGFGDEIQIAQLRERRIWLNFRGDAA